MRRSPGIGTVKIVLAGCSEVKSRLYTVHGKNYSIQNGFLENVFLEICAVSLVDENIYFHNR